MIENLSAENASPPVELFLFPVEFLINHFPTAAMTFHSATPFSPLALIWKQCDKILILINEYLHFRNPLLSKLYVSASLYRQRICQVSLLLTWLISKGFPGVAVGELFVISRNFLQQRGEGWRFSLHLVTLTAQALQILKKMDGVA
jgi:hypothetical protein